MTEAKMREFPAKLDPRLQAIGTIVCHSGIDPRGLSVVRRTVNIKTVAIFEKAAIEKVLFESADPRPILNEKLRGAYGYHFESTDSS